MIMNGAYFNGLDQTDGLQNALKNIPGSVTTDYMLCSLNVAGVDENGKPSADINYGWNFKHGAMNTPGCQFGASPGVYLARGNAATEWTRTHLCKVVSAGVSQGKCQRVWLTIGGAVWGCYLQQTSAFTNIQTIVNKDNSLKTGLLANFGAIYASLRKLGVDVGFDMDYEENGDLASAVADVTIALCQHIYNSFNHMPAITFCPSFALQKNWIEALRKIYSTLKINGRPVQPVVGYNLQCYAGGASNSPKDWADYIKNNATGTGITPAEAPAFVWPIVSCDPDAQPVTPSDQVAAQLENWAHNGTPTGFHSHGASLWATRPTSGPPPDLKVYSKAIAQGIA